MKDYYYFLGVPKDASSEEIKKAYRKLSQKYHPDKNSNDLFFENRFREIQEAYEVLIIEESRKLYDENFGYRKQINTTTLPPKINTFSSTKIRAQKGEEVTLYWQTQNADVVKILPFGLEKISGERKFKITDFKDGKFHVVIQAINSITNQTVVQGITITESANNNNEEGHFRGTEKATENLITPPKYNMPRIFVAIFSLIFLLYFLWRIWQC